MKTNSKFLKAATVSVALLGGTAIVTAVIAPDLAYAGNGNGNGGGKDKSDRGNGNGNGSGKDKSDRGNGGGRDKAERGNGKNAKSDRSRRSDNQVARGGGKSKGRNKSAGSNNRKGGSNTLAGLGRDLKRDVKALFSRDSDTQATRTRTTKARQKASVQPLDASPRPTARDLRARPRPDGKPDRKRLRDPLVAAITDPEGSGNLKNLNASKAAAQAFANASPNSNVGKIATYQDAAEDYYGLRGDLIESQRDLRELDESYDGRSSEEIVDDIAALDPADPDYDVEREALESELEDAEIYETAREDLIDDVKDLSTDTFDALETAEAAFFDASKGRTLSRGALGELHGNLDLPLPKDSREDYAEVIPYPEDGAEIQPVPDEGTEIRPVPSDHTGHGDRPGRRPRDPLVAAITDPEGSGKLKNLNASKAAAQAFANASPNSNVGKIATYQDAAEDFYGLRGDLIESQRDLRELDESYDGRSSEEIVDDIAALDPADPDYDEKSAELSEELADAEAFEEARQELDDDVRDLRRDNIIAAKEAEAAFYAASKGSTLTKDALAELHGYLGLPTPSY